MIAKIAWPALILLVAVLASAGLMAGADDALPPAEPPAAPLVLVEPVVQASVRLDVSSQGVVRPRTSSDLVAEVAGRVERVAPAFVTGAFVEAGTPLAWLDTRDLATAVAAAEASLAQARAALQIEEREAELARDEWDELGGDAEPHALLLREPQLAERRAAEAAAAAELERARRDLERAVLRAPYDARVVERLVDPGAWVTRGARLGRVDALDVAEVRLPVRDEQLAFLDVPLTRDAPSPAAVPVTIEADFAGARWSWSGRVVRSEGGLDPESRMVHLVAEVAEPYASGDVPGRPPLATGLFVDASLQGREWPDVLVVPREALRTDGTVWVVDDTLRLRRRRPDVLRAERERVLVRSGLAPGERVLVSVLEGALEGQLVRVESATEPAP